MRIGLLTGGGECPGLNPAIRGFVYRAVDFGYEVVGIKNGWDGLLINDTRPLNINDVENISGTGGTILGTSETEPLKIEENFKACIDNIKALSLDCIAVIGDEKSLTTASNIYDKGLPAVGVPRTMYNDLSSSDFTLGFDTALTASVNSSEALVKQGKEQGIVTVIEVPGKKSGWIAVYTGLGIGTDWILIPEFPFEREKMCLHIRETYRAKRSASIVISGGVELPGEQIPGETMSKKVASIIEEDTKIKATPVVIDTIKPSNAPTVFDRMLGLRMGVKAAELIAEKKFGYMVCFKAGETTAVPLRDAVSKTRVVDDKWWKLARQLFK